MNFFIFFLLAFVVSFCLVPIVINLARHFEIVDVPRGDRKIHKKPMPSFGGIAPYFGITVVILLILWLIPNLLTDEISIKKIVGVLLAGLVLMIGGFLDDKYDLKPKWQIIFPIIAALAIVASGIGIREITNPFGSGVISLVTWEKVLFWRDGIGYRLSLPSDLFTFIWLMGMMYTTKFLDGLDGLVSGLTAIGALMILFLTLTTQWYQPEVGVLSAIVAGAFIGFLFWNFHPAKIFLGEGGSLFGGFILGVLAIISGGKIATALLVFAIPILDAIWIIFRRVFWEGKSPFKGDRKHLHFRLLNTGLSHRLSVVFLYMVALLFGTLTLVLQSSEKLVALVVLIVLMLIIGSLLVVLGKHRNKSLS